MSIYCERAFCYVDAEDYDNANNDFNQVIKLDPENTSPYFYRAKMYHKLSESEKEKKDYLTAIELNDEDPEGYYYLADFYLKQNKLFHTINSYSKSIIKLSANLGYSITSSNGKDEIELADIYLKRGEVYKNADAIDLMCEDYQKACELGDCEMFNKNCK
jgi:tetratricopeptide (TPR) repeat protein